MIGVFTCFPVFHNIIIYNISVKKVQPTKKKEKGLFSFMDIPNCFQTDFYIQTLSWEIIFNYGKFVLSVKPGLRLETWKNIRGNRLSNLQANNRFPNKPDEVTTVKIFDIGKDRMDNYGARVSGFFRVCKLNILLIIFIS